MNISTEAVRYRQRAFEAFAQAAWDARGEHIHDIILYGSVAREEATDRICCNFLPVFDAPDTVETR